MVVRFLLSRDETQYEYLQHWRNGTLDDELTRVDNTRRQQLLALYMIHDKRLSRSLFFSQFLSRYTGYICK